MTIAPAFFMLLTTHESPGAITFANAGTPFGVGCPATSMFSLIVTGTPNNAPAA